MQNKGTTNVKWQNWRLRRLVREKPSGVHKRIKKGKERLNRSEWM